MKKVSKEFRNEKGSMAVYVSVVLLGFLIFLTTVYKASIDVRKSQLVTVLKVKESYEVYNDDIETIYQKQLKKLNSQ